MSTFNLYVDELIPTWFRYHYQVEADTIEEAIQKIIDCDAECYESEQLYDFYNDATKIEIYDDLTDELLYENSKSDH